MKGYFRAMYEEMTRAGEPDSLDYFWFGFMALLSPVGIPLYYIGVFGMKIMERNNE